MRAFEDFSNQDLAFMDRFKQEHGTARAGEILVRQGDPSARLVTLFSGWAVRHQTLASGERQLLHVVLPGDLIGLESTLSNEPHHSVTAVTDVSFCIFDPARLKEFLAVDSLARRLIRLQVLEQRQLEERLTAVGSCDARRSLAFLIWDLHKRLRRRGIIGGPSFRFPLTQQHLAEALGITTVHVHRILRSLRQESMLRIVGGRLAIDDMDRLRQVACAQDHPDDLRPII